MPKIASIKARQVFDSRGNPTIESEILLDDGNKASAIVPSGVSTGTYEAFEKRDKNNKRYLGKSVFSAINSASVPLLTPIANLTFRYCAKFSSNSLTLGPRIRFPDLNTVSIILRMSVR